MIKRLLLFLHFMWVSIAILIAQPDELYRGRYKEAMMTYGNPYTTFNRKKPNWSLAGDLQKIRDKLIESDGQQGFLSDYARLYSEVYDGAFLLEPSNSGHTGSSTGSPHAVWTKNNAIVWLVGVKYYKDSFNNNRFIRSRARPRACCLRNTMFPQRNANSFKNPPLRIGWKVLIVSA